MTSDFKIIAETEVYSRYLRVIDRETEFPNGHRVKWDIVGHAFNSSGFFVCVFPFDVHSVDIF